MQTLLKHWDRLSDEQRRTYLDKALDSTSHMVEALSQSEVMLRPLVEAGADSIDEKRRGLDGQRRRKLDSLVTRRSDEGFLARVWLNGHGDLLVGEGTADPSPGAAQYAAVAEAILDAVDDLLPGDAEVLHVDLLKIGSVGSATVAIKWDGRRLIGTAELQRDQYDAIARATLDALNRFIAPQN